MFNYEIINSKRLSYQIISQIDQELIYKLRSNEKVIKFTGIKKYEGITEAAEYIDRITKLMKSNECILWKISVIESKIPIGSVCLWNYSEDRKTAEIGYDLLPEFWGKGYASEAIMAVVEFAFNNLKFEVVTAVPSIENNKSNQVLLKCGFVEVGEILEENQLMKKYIRTRIEA